MKTEKKRFKEVLDLLKGDEFFSNLFYFTGGHRKEGEIFFSVRNFLSTEKPKVEEVATEFLGESIMVTKEIKNFKIQEFINIENNQTSINKNNFDYEKYEKTAELFSKEVEDIIEELKIIGSINVNVSKYDKEITVFGIIHNKENLIEIENKSDDYKEYMLGDLKIKEY